MRPCSEDEALIDIRKSLKHPVARGGYRLLGGLAERILAVPQLNAIYDRARVHGDEGFFAAALEAMQVRYRFSEEDAARIPGEGPVFVISNHPFGGLDGVILGDFLLSVRSDFRLLANHLLLRMPEMAPYMFAVNPFGGIGSVRQNATPIRDALQWLKDGHLLATFPSGEVSHYRFRQKRVTDPEWHPVCAKLIRKSGATVLPVYFPGKNSLFFNLCGTLHPRMRTLLLARELVRKQGCEVPLRIGRPIPSSKIGEFDSDEDLLDFLRLRTYLIGAPERRPRGPLRIRPLSISFSPHSRKPTLRLKPLIDPLPVKKLRQEIDRLSPENCLLDRKQFRVYIVKGEESPNLLLELGRLRELTFREVHEGTGEAYDTDHFDQDYLQIFLWDEEKGKIVGGYRLGQTDEILPRKRKRGFYTSTLFTFRTAFLERLDPALELGRSFVVPTYQRKFATLSLIWQGIGAYIARNPRYRYLFGPVSINCEYETLSKDLIIHFLRGKNFDSLLSAKVRAKSPPAKSGLFSREEREAIFRGVKTIDDVSALIAEIEPDRKGVPTLLRHYVKLNARFLSFNVDADFSDVLDGLMIVDLLETDAKTVRFFMGTKNADTFYAYHKNLAKTNGEEELVGQTGMAV